MPLRLIDKPPKTAEEFHLRLELFIGETFRALVAQAPVFRILVRENASFVGMARFHEGLGTYLRAAQAAGLMPSGRDPSLITGIVLDRLGNQVMYASTTAESETTVLNDAAYAETWLAANIDVLIHGAGVAEGRGDIDQIVSAMPKHNYGFREMIQQIVASEAFHIK